MMKSMVIVAFLVLIQGVSYSAIAKEMYPAAERGGGNETEPLPQSQRSRFRTHVPVQVKKTGKDDEDDKGEDSKQQDNSR